MLVSQPLYRISVSFISTADNRCFPISVRGKLRAGLGLLGFIKPKPSDSVPGYEESIQEFATRHLGKLLFHISGPCTDDHHYLSFRRGGVHSSRRSLRIGGVRGRPVPAKHAGSTEKGNTHLILYNRGATMTDYCNPLLLLLLLLLQVKSLEDRGYRGLLAGGLARAKQVADETTFV